MLITVRYYGFVSSLTGRLHEKINLPDGITVRETIEVLTSRYGYKFKELCFLKPLYSRVSYCNINLNARDLNDQRIYPAGLDTVLKDGDVLSFGVISGAA